MSALVTGFQTFALPISSVHDAFAAGASHYGVADLGVLAAETHKFESRYLDGLVGRWPEDRATYEARSPIFHTEGIDRPLAVFQGLADPVVPPHQSPMSSDAAPARRGPAPLAHFEVERTALPQDHH